MPEATERPAGRRTSGWMAAARRVGLFIACAGFALGLQWNRIIPLAGAFAWGGDYGQMVWNLWVVNENARRGVNPLLTKMVYWPVGANLTRHSLASGFLPLTAAVDLLTGHSPLYPFIAFRVGTWLCYALLLLFTYLALRTFGFGRIESTIPAIGYAFCSFYLHHYHLTMLSGWFIPLNVLLLVRWHRAPTTGRAMAAGAGLGAMGYFTEFSAFFGVALVLATAVLACHRAGRAALRRSVLNRRAMPSVLAGAIIAVLAAAPFLLTYVHGPKVIPPDLGAHASGSADLLGLLTPSRTWNGEPATPLYGTLFDPIDHHIVDLSGGYEAFIGFPMLLLAVIGLSRLQRAPWFVLDAAAMALLFLLLTLGPTLRVMGHDTGVPLAYSVLPRIPPFNIQKSPCRLVTYGIFFLSIVAAWGATGLRRWVAGDPAIEHRPRWRGCAAGAVMAVLLAWTIAECYSPRTPLPTYQPPAGLAQVAPGRVLNLPLTYEDGYGEELQVHHRQVMLTGYLARTTVAERRRMDQLVWAYGLGPDGLARFLRTQGVRTVIIAPFDGADPFVTPTGAYIEALAARMHVLDLHESAAQRLADLGASLNSGVGWDAPGATVIPRGGRLEYQHPGGLTAARVDVLADGNDTYEVALLDHGQVVGRLTAGPVPAGGLQWRSLSFRTLTFDRIRIEPHSGDGFYSVGRVIVWDR